MPLARHSAVSAVLDADPYSVICDECGSPLQLHVHRCAYCLHPMQRPLGSPSTLRGRLAAAVDRQQAARTPWTEVADAFYASEAFKKTRIDGAEGGYQVTRWGHTKWLKNLDEAKRFFQQISGRKNK